MIIRHYYGNKFIDFEIKYNFIIIVNTNIQNLFNKQCFSNIQYFITYKYKLLIDIIELCIKYKAKYNYWDYHLYLFNYYEREIIINYIKKLAYNSYCKL